jgi:hypothetical protein
MALERFELEMLGGAVERRWRKARPEIEAMPWGTLAGIDLPDDVRVAARAAWTAAAFQEHQTAFASALTLQALIEVRAPLDLIAFAARFPLDEVAHVELCARMAAELGGGTEILHDPQLLCADAPPGLRPIARAAEIVMRCFCVGEALSMPLLRAIGKVATHPLPRAVLARIVKDEAAHASFGWMFLDWASPLLEPEEVQMIGAAADLAIASLRAIWAETAAMPAVPRNDAYPLGWMQTGPYLELAERSLRDNVIRPLLEREIPLSEASRAGFAHRAES